MSWIVLCRRNRTARADQDFGLESITSAIKVKKGVKITTGKYPDHAPHVFASRADADGAADRLWDHGYQSKVMTPEDAEARYAPIGRKINPRARKPTATQRSAHRDYKRKIIAARRTLTRAIRMRDPEAIAEARSEISRIEIDYAARMRDGNPVPPSSVLKERIAEAARLRRDFTGHDSDRVEKAEFSVPSVALQIGECDGIMYTTVRDGVTEKYLHKFKKKSRPTLAVSHDGKTLVLLGGAFQFTDRGIVDD